jgi:hypothetical protein
MLKRKRSPLVLTELAEESSCEMHGMVAELCKGKSGLVKTPVAVWARRFAASGKAVGKIHRSR